MSRSFYIKMLIVSMLAGLWQVGTVSAAPAPHQPAFEDAVAAYDAGDFPRAFDIWHGLAEQNDPAAMRNLGHMLRRGLGVPRDLEAAFSYYKRAAELGLPTAQLNLAEAYETGAGTAPNLTEARHWLNVAAMAGHPLAQYRYGKMLADGAGGPVKNEEALVFLTAALQAGVPGAVEAIEQVMTNLHPKLAANGPDRD